jgi:predicted  nucleic acid-binding Zn-ribbon protein
MEDGQFAVFGKGAGTATLTATMSYWKDGAQTVYTASTTVTVTDQGLTNNYAPVGHLSFFHNASGTVINHNPDLVNGPSSGDLRNNSTVNFTLMIAPWQAAGEPFTVTRLPTSEITAANFTATTNAATGEFTIRASGTSIINPTRWLDIEIRLVNYPDVFMTCYFAVRNSSGWQNSVELPPVEVEYLKPIEFNGYELNIVNQEYMTEGVSNPIGDFTINAFGELMAYTGTDEVVLIPSNVIRINQNAFQSFLPSMIIIPDNVKIIGERAFTNASNAVAPEGKETTIVFLGQIAPMLEGGYNGATAGNNQGRNARYLNFPAGATVIIPQNGIGYGINWYHGIGFGSQQNNFVTGSEDVLVNLLLAQITELQAAIAALEGANDMLIEEVKELLATVNAYLAIIQGLETIIAQLEYEIANHICTGGSEEYINQLLATIVSLEGMIEQLEIVIEGLEGMIEELEEEIVRLEAIIVAKDKAIADLQKEIADLKAEIAGLKAQIWEQEEIDRKLAEIEEKIKQNEELIKQWQKDRDVALACGTTTGGGWTGFIGILLLALTAQFLIMRKKRVN